MSNNVDFDLKTNGSIMILIKGSINADFGENSINFEFGQISTKIDQF